MRIVKQDNLLTRTDQESGRLMHRFSTLRLYLNTIHENFHDQGAIECPYKPLATDIVKNYNVYPSEKDIQ